MNQDRSPNFQIPRTIIQTTYTRHHSHNQHKSNRKPNLLLLLLVILLTIALLHMIALTHSAYPSVAITNCTDFLHHVDYTKHLPPLSSTQEIAAIQDVNELIDGRPATMLQVTDTQQSAQLDLYIYGCRMQNHKPSLSLLFQQQHIPQGTASLTRAHTLSICQVDSTIKPDTAAQLLPLQQNIFHEYRWYQNAFIPIQFPALYPVTSRAEAEALQDEAKAAIGSTWSDPVMTTRQMAADLLHWSENDYTANLQDKNMTTAHVALLNEKLHMNVTATLTRLIQTDANGLWFITAAQTPDVTLDQASLTPVSISQPELAQNQTGQTFTTPLIVQGTMQQAKGHINMQLFDHTLTALQLAQDPPLSSIDFQPDGHFKGTLYYTPGPLQQSGLLLIQNLPDNDRDNGQLLLTIVQLN